MQISSLQLCLQVISFASPEFLPFLRVFDHLAVRCLALLTFKNPPLFALGDVFFLNILVDGEVVEKYTITAEDLFDMDPRKSPPGVKEEVLQGQLR